MGRRSKKSLGINLKARKQLIIRLELALEPGTSIVFVVEQQGGRRIEKKKGGYLCIYKRYNGEAKELLLLEKKDTSYGS